MRTAATPLLSRRSAAVTASASISAKARVTALQQSGREIVDLTLGEPDAPTPAHILDAAMRAMREGDTHYTASNGTLALREAVTAKLAGENSIHCTPAEVIVGSGAKQLIQMAFAATLDEGDEVILPTPCWLSYADIARLAGGNPRLVACPEEGDFKLRPERLEAAIGPRTKWLVLNSPNNPTGAVYSAAELRALADVLIRHPHVLLLSDEIYEHFVYDGAVAASPAAVAEELAHHVLTVNGVSKAYAMTGWRIGYAAGPADLIAAMTKLISQATTCPSSVSQAAAVAALSGPQDVVADTVRLYRGRRDRMFQGLAGVPGLSCRQPAGAFYLFPSVAGLIEAGRVGSDRELAGYLLEEAGVACLEGGPYGASPYLRLSFAASMESIERGCARIVEACARLVT